MIRTKMSVPPPGANGITIRIGFVGQVWADAGKPNALKIRTSALTNHFNEFFIFAPKFSIFFFVTHRVTNILEFY
jgi:hypothetical protein